MLTDIHLQEQHADVTVAPTRVVEELIDNILGGGCYALVKTFFVGASEAEPSADDANDQPSEAGEDNIIGGVADEPEPGEALESVGDAHGDQQAQCTVEETLRCAFQDALEPFAFIQNLFRRTIL